METYEYKRKILDLLDPVTYEKLKRDPTLKILRQVNSLIRKSSISEDIRKKIYRTEAVPPRFYGLPKIHKTGTPLRPIVSTIGSPTYDVARYLASLLRPHLRQSESYIRDSAHFVKKLNCLQIEPEDQLISFDVVSLFTKVPIIESMDYISKLFPKDITDLFHSCLTTIYFLWNGEFYQQNEGVAMGSLLSPVIANFYMEKFEEIILETAPLKPKAWYRYVDDTFIVWNHGQEELDNFLQHLNSKNRNIQFTMEKERDGELSFLDVLVKREGQRLGHKVYRKPTHTDRYLNSQSNHHPSQKMGVIKTLTERARTVCQPTYLRDEIAHLKETFLANGYSEKQIRRVMRATKKTKTESANKEPAKSKAFLQYIPRVTDRIGKLLKKTPVQDNLQADTKIARQSAIS